MRWDDELPRDLVEQIWQEPDTLITEGELLQDKLRCSVARIDHAAGQFVWKRHFWGNWPRTIGRILSRSVSRQSWCDARFLQAAGVPTPRPRAYLEHRIGPFQWSSYLLTNYVAGTTLYRLMRYVSPTPEYVRHLARQVAGIWQQLDDLCVWHNDLKTENLLVDPSSNVWLIDFEKMRRFGNRQAARRRQAGDAARLLHPRNWRATPWAAELFRLEILKTTAAIQTLSGPLAREHPLARPVPTSNHPSQLVTVLIPCRNDEDTIEACIESVRDMADEILVADAGSTDDTIGRVRRLGGCRIVRRQLNNQIEFERWANRLAQHAWVLRVLPNERLDAELSKQVQDTIAAEPAADGFRITRVDCSQGHHLCQVGFRRDQPIRLYRRDVARFEVSTRGVEVVLETRRIGRLSGCVTYGSRENFRESVEKTVRVSGASSSLDADRPRMRSAA
jgi:hypothetical protein